MELVLWAHIVIREVVFISVFHYTRPMAFILKEAKKAKMNVKAAATMSTN